MDGLARMRAAGMGDARGALGECAVGKTEACAPVRVLVALGEGARVRLVEGLVMAAGGAEAFPGGEALGALAARLCRAGGVAGGMTLAGAWVRVEDGVAVISQAPPRRGQVVGAAPCWERAHALLADPGLAALSV